MLNQFLLTGRINSKPKEQLCKNDSSQCFFYLWCQRGKQYCTFPIICFNDLAEYASEHYSKGQEVAVHGYMSMMKAPSGENTVRLIATMIAPLPVMEEKKAPAPASEAEEDSGYNYGEEPPF
jgi:single-stranded DNA-binding protein